LTPIIKCQISAKIYIFIGVLSKMHKNKKALQMQGL
jgi:hypothetical protein